MTALLAFASAHPLWTLLYLWSIGLTAIGVAHGIGKLAVVKNIRNVTEKEDDD